MQNISSPVIIMALYDIGRDDWNAFTVSYNTYLFWMKNTLALNANIVIYTEEKFVSKIKEYRQEFDPKLENTRIVVKPLEELDCYKIYGSRLQALMSSNDFKKKINVEVPEMTQYLYNVIMFNKLYFLKDAKNNNYFNADMLIWADAGGLRESIENYKGQVWPSLDKINSLDNSKITFFSHSNNITVNNKEYHALSQIRFIQGTAFIVPINLLDGLIKDFDSSIEECIQDGYIGSDEKIFDITYCKNKSAYNLIKCTWRTYFNIFKNDGINIFNKNTNKTDKALLYLGAYECGGLSKLIDILNVDESWEIQIFEPNPLIDIQYFAKELSNYNISAHKKAIWKRTGKTVFNQYGEKGKSQGSLIEETDGGKGYWDYFDSKIVECISLSDVIESIDKNKKIYIYMDIEWSEYEVLENLLSKGWPKNIQKLWIEWHGTNGHQKLLESKSLEQRIKQHGTEIENV